MAAAPTPPPTQAPAAPTLPFEGEIVVAVKQEAAKVPARITFDVKGDKVRYTSDNSLVRTVADVAADHVYEVNEARKAFADVEPKPVASNVKVTKSAYTEKLAGAPCEVWGIEDANGTVDVCVAKGIPFFDLTGEPKSAKAGKAEPEWAAALTREKAFPLSVVAYDKQGKEEYRAEAVAVASKKLDDSMFRVPTGFKKTEVSSEMLTASLP
jgi:hypothetical protein